MTEKTLLKLEYNKIIELLVEHASSENGKLRCKNLKPMTDLAEIDAAQEQTAAAFTRIVKKGRLNFSGCCPVEDSMKRLEVGAALSAPELLRICKLLEVANRAKTYGRHDTVEELADCLDTYFEQLAPLTPLSTEIRRCVLSEEEISDDASSNLRNIRRNMALINDKVHTTLTSLVNGSLKS